MTANTAEANATATTSDERTEIPPEEATASGISGNVFKDITDWEPRQVQTLDTKDACGKDETNTFRTAL